MMEVLFVKHYPQVMFVWIGSRDPALFENATDGEVAEAAAKVFRKYFNNPEIPVPRIMR